MGGRTSRRKGAAGEREFFELCNSALESADWPYRDRHGRVFFRHPAPRHGRGQPDNSDAHGCLPVSIEVKRVEKPQFKRWIAKLQEQTRPTQVPVLAWRQNNQPWTVMAIMDEEEWREYLKWKFEGK